MALYVRRANFRALFVESYARMVIIITIRMTVSFNCGLLK